MTSERATALELDEARVEDMGRCDYCRAAYDVSDLCDYPGGLVLCDECTDIDAHELFAPGARKSFLRLAGRKGETPGDIFRQLAAICDQEDVEVRGERE